ncbi:LysR family transcriptional regulator [Kordiimonas sp. SCSIO 12603]|uniref:LysR family transcriptional regulator n=1 Tax=Kordiimonas sp. SCSIO 12603 TaxID=2829596 RepID=UPI002107C8FC|nr:LysR family transcriptional regulator [Kordiimonas sp. SCSIO 12603]UTW59321.1 LysR family transcriptional regulator [Kordiimonas sp. SCSIO 12603]
MDILSLKLFLRVAALGAVSAAARDLSLSPASASARLSKLEETVGFILFNRTTRAVSLTTDGAAFHPYAEQMIETLENGLNMVCGNNQATQGQLRVTMPGSFARMHIIPYLAEFHEKFPDIQLDLRLSDEVLDLVEGAYDLSIRNAPLADSSMIARKLAPDKRLLLASPDYIGKYGAPTSPEDLMNHRCVILGDRANWKFENGQTIQVQRNHVVNDGEAMRMMLKQGLGIGMKSLWNGYKELSKGTLVEVMPDYPLLTESAIWAIYPSNRIIAPKVRVFIDFLLRKFRPTAPWEEEQG